MDPSDLVVAVAYLGFAALSVALAVIDVREHRLPNRLVLPAYPAVLVLFALACALGAPWTRFGGAAAGMAVLFVVFAVFRLASRAGLGGGDVKLAGVVGGMLGWIGWDAVLVGVFAAFLLGGLFGLLLLALRRADRRTRFAFGPWMLAGAWAGVAAGAMPLASAA